MEENRKCDEVNLKEKTCHPDKSIVGESLLEPYEGGYRLREEELKFVLEDRPCSGSRQRTDKRQIADNNKKCFEKSFNFVKLKPFSQNPVNSETLRETGHFSRNHEISEKVVKRVQGDNFILLKKKVDCRSALLCRQKAITSPLTPTDKSVPSSVKLDLRSCQRLICLLNEERGKSRAAFTLAEVLITLSILGVVAAIMIPSTI